MFVRRPMGAGGGDVMPAAAPSHWPAVARGRGARGVGGGGRDAGAAPGSGQTRPGSAATLSLAPELCQYCIKQCLLNA